MGTKTYGLKTASGYSTSQELQFIMEEKKPFFFIKMCDRFEIDMTRFYLPNTVSYVLWTPGTPMPGNLVKEIATKLGSLSGPGAQTMPIASLSASSLSMSGTIAETLANMARNVSNPGTQESGLQFIAQYIATVENDGPRQELIKLNGIDAIINAMKGFILLTLTLISFLFNLILMFPLSLTLVMRNGPDQFGANFLFLDRKLRSSSQTC